MTVSNIILGTEEGSQNHFRRSLWINRTVSYCADSLRVCGFNPMQAEQPGLHKGSFHGTVGPGAFGAMGARTSHPYHPHLLTHPSRDLSSFFHPFVGLFHFDFMFAHLMDVGRGEERNSKTDPMRPCPLCFLHTMTQTYTIKTSVLSKKNIVLKFWWFDH